MSDGRRADANPRQLERRRVPDGSAIANAIDYSLNRWTALMTNLVDGDVPIDNGIRRDFLLPGDGSKCQD